MTEWVSPERMREIEARAEQMGVSRLLLMECAGKGVSDFLKRRFGNLRGMRVAAVCGLGNNGGDGFVAARHLAGYGAKVRVFLLGRSDEIRTPEARRNWEVLERMPESVELVQLPDTGFWEKLEESLGWDILVDAILGTGIKGELREPFSTVIRKINSSRAFRLAVDVPSGLDPASGEVCGLAVAADATVTMHRAKPGLLARPDLVGELEVVNIGIPPEAEKFPAPRSEK